MDTHEQRYVIGIDLGTTNSAMAWVDRKHTMRQVRGFPVTQWVAPDTLEALEHLPSFHYEPARGELDELRLPWDSEPPGFLVGTLARDHGADVPGRLISSAKSWLCHGGVDRTADLLPWQGGADVQRMAPARVCSRFLLHMRRAWNGEHPKYPMEEQEVVLTVPASFDEVARELTVEAARLAGLPRVALIEEPLAAFYSWMDAQPREELERLPAGETTLVCDVGGGTTDFTLIRSRTTPRGEREFHRLAVGDHLILGGDNLDMTLARYIEENKLEHPLGAHQYVVLIRRCRQAKETLLGEAPPEHFTIHLPAAGARLIDAAIQIELSRKEVATLLVDGFLPHVEADAVPLKPASGFREFGLPYAPDHGITRYLAQFLRAHHGAPEDTPLRPDALLLNGGFFAAPQLKQRLVDVLRSWFPEDPSWTPRLLDNPRLDLAVARGAACYGLARLDDGIRIKAGIPRTYYVGVTRARDDQIKALCLTPAGLDEGQTIRLEHTFDIRLHEPVEFPIFCSASRTTDQPGDLIEPDPLELSALPPIRTVLRSGRIKEAATTRVCIEAHANETGTLEMSCREIAGDRSWKLRFDVRSTTQTDIQAHGGEAEQAGILEEDVADRARALISGVFAGDAPPDSLMKRLEESIGQRRGAWPPSLLRALWEVLMSHHEGRLRTAAHEIRWLNMTGFCLRPGYGLALDDWRVGRLWQLLNRHKPVFGRNEQACAEWWVLWRRVGGGLKANQQRNLAQPLLAALRTSTRTGKKQVFGAGPHESAERCRLLASLEWLDAETKILLGEQVLGAIEREGVGAWHKAAIWALARLGAREPLHGAVNTVVDAAIVARWLERLLACGAQGSETHFACMHMARCVHDRFRDLPPPLRERTAGVLEAGGATGHYVSLVREGGALEQEDMSRALGDGLPPGLRMCEGAA